MRLGGILPFESSFFRLKSKPEMYERLKIETGDVWLLGKYMSCFLCHL